MRQVQAAVIEGLCHRDPDALCRVSFEQIARKTAGLLAEDQEVVGLELEIPVGPLGACAAVDEPLVRELIPELSQRLPPLNVQLQPVVHTGPPDRLFVD